MPDCGCTHEKPCECEGCREKDSLIRQLYEKIDELKKALNVSAGSNERCVRH